MSIRGYLLDVEGVLVADKRYGAVPGAVEFIRQVRASGRPLRLITNNTTDGNSAIIEKLVRAGFDFAVDELHTCTSAAVHALRTKQARHCLVLGAESLKAILRDGGLNVVDGSDVDAVVVGLDTGLTYERLRTACDAIVRHGALFVALHRNRVYTDAEGRVAPSVGPTVAAIEYATQAKPIVTGKPSRDYFQQALDDIGLPPADVLIVSDDPFSDLAGAKRIGLQTAFVLSGKYGDAGVVESIPEAERPDVITARIGELPAPYAPGS